MKINTPGRPLASTQAVRLPAQKPAGNPAMKAATRAWPMTGTFAARGAPTGDLASLEHLLSSTIRLAARHEVN